MKLKIILTAILISEMQALKVESGYICLIIAIFIVSIIPFCYTIAWCFSRNAKMNGVRSVVQTSARIVLPDQVVFQNDGKEKLKKYNRRKRVYVVLLLGLIVLSM